MTSCLHCPTLQWRASRSTKEARGGLFGADHEAATTDAAGRFRVEGLGPGVVSMYIRAPQGPRIELKDVVLGVGEAAELGDVEMVTPAPGSAESSGRLGLALDASDRDAIVLQVPPGSPAALAGVVPGDHVLAIDAVTVKRYGARVVVAYMQPPRFHVGQYVRLVIEHDGKRRTIDLVVAARP